MLGKLMFHDKNRMVPGNFSMKPVALENIDAGDMFELCVDFLDQIENTILLMKTIFNSFEKGNKSISLTKEGQCRLAALVILAYITNHVLYLRYITYKLRGIATGRSGEAQAPPQFGSSVNPIQTGGRGKQPLQYCRNHNSHMRMQLH